MAKQVLEPWYQAPETEIVCALCGCIVPPAQRDEHHLIPKSRGGRETTPLHRICHRRLHALFTKSQLASNFATVEALLGNVNVQKFVAWVRKKPPDFYERTRRSADKA